MDDIVVFYGIKVFNSVYFLYFSVVEMRKQFWQRNQRNLIYTQFDKAFKDTLESGIAIFAWKVKISVSVKRP